MLGLTTALNKVLAGTVIALVISGYILFSSLVGAKAKITTLEATNKALITQIEHNTAIQKSFEASHQNIIIQYQSLEQKHREHSSKESVVIAKPKLVEKLANRKFKKQEKEMACLTGNTSKC